MKGGRRPCASGVDAVALERVGAVDDELLARCDLVAHQQFEHTPRVLGVADADAENAGRVFELLMGNEVAPRKEFIIDSSDTLERDRIDA